MKRNNLKGTGVFFPVKTEVYPEFLSPQILKQRALLLVWEDFNCVLYFLLLSPKFCNLKTLDTFCSPYIFIEELIVFSENI